MHLLGSPSWWARPLRVPRPRCGAPRSGPAQTPLPPALPGGSVGQAEDRTHRLRAPLPRRRKRSTKPALAAWLTKPDARGGGGLGHSSMAEAVKALEGEWGPQPIRIRAQAHLKSFYASAHGFAHVGGTCIEDGIPHLEMLRGA